MALPLKMMLMRIFCNFNAISLALLAFQNAGYLVLMGYAQRLQDVPPAAGEPAPKRLVSSHFLATTEFTKLVFSILWCTYEVLQEMRVQEQESLLASVEVEHEEDTMEKGEGLGGEAHNSAAANANRDVRPMSPGSPSKPMAYDDYPLTRLFERPNFYAQFSSRMRHAIGFDGKWKEAMLMIVPAVLYTIQGLLLILALQCLDPTVFQILYQVRIMFLAVMMRVVLDFQLSPIRWLALVGLMVGICMAQLAMQRNSTQRDAEQNTAPRESRLLEGTLTALAGAFLSSFSGVFMEFVFKKRGNLFTLSARNIHLAFFSLVYFWFVFARDVWNGTDALAEESNVGGFLASFFDGFTGLVWFLVVLQAAGGILVALVVRYCDNIVKSFSTAFAIVLSGTASVFLFNLPLEPLFLLGSLLVMVSITVYSLKK